MSSSDDGPGAQLTEIAKVDLRGLVVPGTPEWAEASAALTASMVNHGCVVVVHDAVGTELRRALFGRALPELFALPFDVKKRSGFFSNGPNKPYDSQVSNAVLESVPIPNAAEPGAMGDWASRLWPQGNRDFCDTMLSFAKSVAQLEETVERMTLEGLGAREESIRGHLGSLSHGVRIALYGTPTDKETGVSLRAHRDDHMSAVIVQHEVGGLEVQLDDGRWVAVPPEPGTVTLVAGDQFTVVTNGRVPACVHRVRTPCGPDLKRFSAMLNTRRKREAVVRAMDDLVDEDPLMYNPYACEEYTAFLYSNEGFNLRDTLKAFCGVKKDGSME